MKRKAVCLTIAVLWATGLGVPSALAQDVSIPDPAVVAKALEGVDSDLFRGMTQEELQAQYDNEIGKSRAYKGADSVIDEDIAVGEETVTIYRYMSGEEQLGFYGDILWTAIAAFLVFFMQAGFALVETRRTP